MRIYRCLAGAVIAAAVITAAAAMFASAQEAAPKVAAAAEPAKSTLEDCITDTANFKAEDKRALFVVALENKCEQRVKCEVKANIRTARGKRRGHATLILAPKSAGADSKKSYSLRVKVAGGMAQVERNCTAF